MNRLIEGKIKSDDIYKLRAVLNWGNSEFGFFRSQNNTASMYDQGFHSLSSKTSYRKISWNLESVKSRYRLFQSLRICTGTSAAGLPRCLSNFRAIRSLQYPISRLRDFTWSCGKTSYRVVNRGPVVLLVWTRSVSSAYAHICVVMPAVDWWKCNRLNTLTCNWH